MSDMSSSLPPALWNIPLELKRRIACFLSPRDAIQVTRTCKSLRSSLALSSLEPNLVLFERIARIGEIDTGDNPRRGFRFPLWNRRVHSVSVTFLWRDQGWGNSKGQIFVVESKKTAQQDTGTTTEDQFGGGRVIFQSGIAPHAEERLQIEFCPSDGKQYYLWYKAGGGGGHAIYLIQGRLRTIIFDDPQHTMSRTYETLQSVGVLGGRGGFDLEDISNERSLNRGNYGTFYPQMFLGVCKSIKQSLESGSKPDSNLTTVFANFGLQVSEATILAVEELVQNESLEMSLRERESIELQHERQRRSAELEAAGEHNNNEVNGRAARVININIAHMPRRFFIQARQRGAGQEVVEDDVTQ